MLTLTRSRHGRTMSLAASGWCLEEPKTKTDELIRIWTQEQAEVGLFVLFELPSSAVAMPARRCSIEAVSQVSPQVTCLHLDILWNFGVLWCFKKSVVVGQSWLVVFDVAHSLSPNLGWWIWIDPNIIGIYWHGSKPQPTIQSLFPSQQAR